MKADTRNFVVLVAILASVVVGLLIISSGASSDIRKAEVTGCRLRVEDRIDHAAVWTKQAELAGRRARNERLLPAERQVASEAEREFSYRAKRFRGRIIDCHVQVYEGRNVPDQRARERARPLPVER